MHTADELQFAHIVEFDETNILGPPDLQVVQLPQVSLDRRNIIMGREEPSGGQ